jgi:hypothetical protein
MPSRDYEEFIAAFHAHGVRFLVLVPLPIRREPSYYPS